MLLQVCCLLLFQLWVQGQQGGWNKADHRDVGQEAVAKTRVGSRPGGLGRTPLGIFDQNQVIISYLFHWGL